MLGFSDPRLHLESMLHGYKPDFKTEKAGPVSSEIETMIGFALDLTRYGQFAMQLDLSGALANWNRRLQAKACCTDTKSGIKPKITWMGC